MQPQRKLCNFVKFSQIALSWLIALYYFSGFSHARPAPPSIAHGEFQLRRLRVGTLELENATTPSIRWDAFDFAALRVEFDQPIFIQRVNVPGAHNSVSSASELDRALMLECPRSLSSGQNQAGMHLYPLEENFPKELWSTNQLAHEQDTSVHYFEPRLLLATSPQNSLRGLLTAFQIFDNDDSVVSPDVNSASVSQAHGSATSLSRADAVNHASTSLELLIPIAKRRLAKSADAKQDSTKHQTTADNPSTYFDASVLESCVIRYIPTAQRGLSQASAVALTSRRGVEASDKPLNLVMFEPVSAVERTVLRLSASPHSRAAAWAHTHAKLRSGELVGAGRPRHDGDAYGADVAILLEAETQVRGYVALMFDPVIGGFIKPVVDLTHGLLMDSFGGHFQKKIATTTVSEVAADLTQTLGIALRANISNILTDSLTYSIGRSLSDGFIATITPVVQDKLKKFLPKSVGAMLNKVLLLNIPAYVNEHMPQVVARGLSVTLMQGLTRSISHALVPTLTHALPHSANADYYCYVCATQNDACHLCHFSALSVYYQAYYGTYYTDYFSDYYGNYYTHALRRVDEATHQKIKVPGHVLLSQSSAYLERSKIPVAE